MRIFQESKSQKFRKKKNMAISKIGISNWRGTCCKPLEPTEIVQGMVETIEVYVETVQDVWGKP